MGKGALASNVDGGENTAVGHQALATTTESFNTAVGYQALTANTTGNDNAAVGWLALTSNDTGDSNVAIGSRALSNNTSGDGNVAIGQDAGKNANNPSNSIFIGNQGLAADTTTIKIGTQGTQNTAFIAGIFGAGTTSGVAVLIDSTGKLGTTASSRRYKEDIHSMAPRSDMLSRLRPVSFRYKKPQADGSKPVQYGLIAEEVAEVFPYLAVFNEKGQPETVKYHELPTLLLEGFQEQQKIIAAQAEQIAQQRAMNDAQAEQLAHQQVSLNAQADQLREQRASMQAEHERIVALENSLRIIEAQLTRPSVKTASDSR